MPKIHRQLGLGSAQDGPGDSSHLTVHNRGGPHQGRRRGRCLADIAEGRFPDALHVSQPNNPVPFDTPRDALDWTFQAHVGLPARSAGEGGDAPPSRAGRPVRAAPDAAEAVG